MTYLRITPRDPFIARDGRPFGSGQSNRMRCLEWPYPSVLAGSIRTLLGKSAGRQFDPPTLTALKAIEIAGPFPAREGTLYMPAPLDCVIQRDPDRALALRPGILRAGEGTCLTPAGLSPCFLPPDLEEGFKPGSGPAFWSRERMGAWLASPVGNAFLPPPKLPLDKGEKRFLAPEKEERVHVAMDSATGAAKEHKLFTTTGLVVPEDVVLAARVCAGDGFAATAAALDAFHSFGGERRLAHFAAADHAKLWKCPGNVRTALAIAKRVRMVLAAPAIFSGGWKPGWLNGHLRGSPPGCAVTLKLVGACVERWRPVSGWSLEPPLGPKAIRRMAPAGSVYFFNVEDNGSAAGLADRWLESVSDSEQSPSQAPDQTCRDGFGLAMWGVWDSLEEN